MAEVMIDVRGLDRAGAWREVDRTIRAVLDGPGVDEVAAMATISCVVHQAFGWLWCGFYRVVAPGDRLRVGPYQGSLGCLEIAFGRGVCGAVAARRLSIVVPDVEAFPGHIACDSASRSELVVPVFDRGGSLIAVLDLDASTLAEFGEIDRLGAERVVSWFAGVA